MKQKNIVLSVCIALTAIIVGYDLLSKNSQVFPITPATVEGAKSTKVGDVVFVLFDGNTIATFSAQAKGTVLHTLEAVTTEHHIVLETKSYDFGTLVTQIWNKQNSKDYAWIYSVNGKDAQVGADKQEIHPGDVIEWVYKKTY